MNTKTKFYICLFALPFALPIFASANMTATGGVLTKTIKPVQTQNTYSTSGDQEAVNAVIVKIGACAKYSTSEEKVTCLTEVLLDLTKILINRSTRPSYEDKNIKKPEERPIIKNDTTPKITSLSANKGKIGDTITIYGNGFKSRAGKVYVSFIVPGKGGFSSISPIEVSDTAVKFKFEEKSQLYSSFGDTAGKIVEVKLYLTYENEHSQVHTNNIPFYFDGTNGGTIIINKDVTPTIKALSANKGRIGDTINIYGTGFKSRPGKVYVSFAVPDKGGFSSISPIEVTENTIKFKFEDKSMLYSFFGDTTGKMVELKLFLTYENENSQLHSNKIDFVFDDSITTQVGY